MIYNHVLSVSIHGFVIVNNPACTQFRDSILKQLETKLTSGVDNDVFIIMAASIYYHEQVQIPYIGY